ncbi:MurR/RpiR family transcriptional regulator [Arthrobacter bambusae]|uniref:MurR/RpiR family transcriptional regulator n=1 Tax=Arthrobacter bambusae TaxID=1338426 RepID=UPI001F50E5CC|nr:MurR/RpiR family transcriptional regulator [Arthrobacter bambusae]MCI0144084.1 MurR/RpiR family transcriptional regulator [Arthrobacter bambusae]
MALQDRLSLEAGNLTPAERRTATVLLQDSKDVVFLSATEVAARANVHESTVIRLAQKLGYDGFAALRGDLREQAQRVDVSARARFRDRKGYQLAKLVEDEAQALLGMVETIDQDRLDALAQTLIDARRIYVYGAPILVASLEKRLRRLGLDVVDLPSEGRDLPEKLLSLGKGDVFFAFVLREPNPALAKLAKHAELQGADVVVISDVPGVSLSVVPKHLIIALRGADSTFGTMTVPIVFGYALELSIYHLSQDKAADALNRLGSLASILGKPGSR